MHPERNQRQDCSLLAYQQLRMALMWNIVGGDAAWVRGRSEVYPSPNVLSAGEAKTEIFLFFGAREKEIAGCKAALMDAAVMS